MDYNTKRKKPAYQTFIHQFCIETTAHGLTRVVESKSFVGRIFWLLVFLLALSLMFYQVVLLLQSYFTYPVHVEVKLVHQKEWQFAGATVCNVNPFRKSKIESSTLGSTNVSN